MSVWLVECKSKITEEWHVYNAAFESRRWAEIFAEDILRGYEFRIREYAPKEMYP